MPRTATRTARATKSAAAKPAASAAKHGERISLGSVWEIDHPKLAAAGVPAPADDNYDNEDSLLALLPEPKEGYQWVLKLFHNSSDNPKAPVYDVCLQEEPIYRR